MRDITLKQQEEQIMLPLDNETGPHDANTRKGGYKYLRYWVPALDVIQKHSSIQFY